MSDYVSDDSINEIFERLPAKSLLRFRSLSKSWCSRIQSPDFIHRHVLRSRKKSPKIFIGHSICHRDYINYRDSNDMYTIHLCHRDYINYRDSNDMYTIHSEDQFVSSNPEWLDVSLPAVKVPNSIGNRLIGEIVGSCNGVLCLFHYNKNTISLWNPSIRHVTIVPSAPKHYRASLVGFGFDPSIDDYKIVRISQKRSFVYTLKKRVWCPIASPTTDFCRRQKFCVCFLNGALHWVVTEYSNHQRSEYILTFNLTTHVFGKISLPDTYWQTIELTVINSSLAVIPETGAYHPLNGENSRIWILKEYNNVSFWDAYEFGQLGLGFYPSGRVKSCLQLTTNGHILLIFNDTRATYYGVYNPGTGKLDPAMIMYFQDSWPDHMETYVDSLELLDTKLGKNKMKKMNKTEETASHNVTLRKSEISKYFY